MNNEINKKQTSSKFNIPSFTLYLLFSIITLGIYSLYFNYKSQKSAYSKNKSFTDPILFVIICVLFSGFTPIIFATRAHTLAEELGDKDAYAKKYKKIFIITLISIFIANITVFAAMISVALSNSSSVETFAFIYYFIAAYNILMIYITSKAYNYHKSYYDLYLE